jgi:hypothetical protein
MGSAGQQQALAEVMPVRSAALCVKEMDLKTALNYLEVRRRLWHLSALAVQPIDQGRPPPLPPRVLCAGSG